jgi:NitT/TauT family transport system ATP-binding protein
MGREGAVAAIRMQGGASASSLVMPMALPTRRWRVDLAIGEGEFLCVLGPTGCGKSTVMHLVAGFDTTEGRVLVAGKPVTGRARPGMVFQNDRALFPWLTVDQNVAFGLEVAHAPAAVRAAVDSNLELVGLTGHRPSSRANSPAEEAAGADRARAGDRPAILLMDEPFAALDAQTRRRMQEELGRIWAVSRKTVLFITHDIGEAIWLGDRIAVMTHGPAARIKEVIDVDLPRPRQNMTPGFVSLYNTLDASIRAESEAMHNA